MLKFWKKFRYFAMGAVALQFWGCGIGEFFGNLLGDAVSFTALDPRIPSPAVQRS